MKVTQAYHWFAAAPELDHAKQAAFIVKFSEEPGVSFLDAFAKSLVSTPKDVEALLSEVEALCRVYVGKDAESEEWGQTCQRLARIDKLVKKVRKAQAR